MEMLTIITRSHTLDEYNMFNAHITTEITHIHRPWRHHSLLQLGEQRLGHTNVQRMDVVEQLFLARLCGLRLGVDAIVAVRVAAQQRLNLRLLLALLAQRLLGAHNLLFLLLLLSLDGRNDVRHLLLSGHRLRV